jgi:beta-lactamase regulating signal transducer with metallopeptidase domain
MIATYFVRLLILCFASFFLVHLALGLLSLYLFPRFARTFASATPQWASRISIALRLAPACLSIFAVLCVCLPSYLRYEGNLTTEEVGWPSLVLAALGLLIGLLASARAVRAILQSSALSKNVRAAKDPDYWYLTSKDDVFPSIALVGLLEPRIVISPGVLETLTTEQFQATLDHERAHRSSNDNLKRLFILLAPDLVPFVRSFRRMEDHWNRYSELSADDLATRGRPDRSIALAEALIKLAKFEGGQLSPPLVSGLFSASEGLTLRVERLLRLETPTQPSPRLRALFWAGPFLLLFSSALLFLRPQLFEGVYHLLEAFLR